MRISSILQVSVHASRSHSFTKTCVSSGPLNKQRRIAGEDRGLGVFRVSGGDVG